MKELRGIFTAMATPFDESGAVDNDAATKARAEFRRRFCSLEDGHAAERVVRTVFLD